MSSLVYTLRRYSRAKSLKILLHADGGVTVTAPKRVSKQLIEAFVNSRKDWIEHAQSRLRAQPRKFAIHGTAAEYQAHKQAALRLAHERLKHFNQVYAFAINEVVIRNPKSRWGSCSSKGRLMFSYKISLLPPELADYIIVHELCHVAEMNHSAAFWCLVAQTIPEYKRYRSRLRAA